MGLFDPQTPVEPPAPLMDYGVTSAKRQRLLAEALRKQAGTATPQGQMVSGHYVAPSWTQHLATIAGGAGAGYMEGKAQEAEDKSTAEIAAARQKALSSLPQAVAAQYGPQQITGLGGREKINEGELIAPAKPLTREDVARKTIELMQIPGTEKIAEVYNKGAMAEIDREDKQVEAQRAQIAQLEERRAEAERRSNDQARSDWQRSEDKKEQRLWEEKREAADRALQLQIAGIKAASKGSGGDLDRLPAAQITAYVGNQKAVGDIDQAIKLVEANPNAVGYKGYLPDVAISRMGTDAEKATRAAIANIGSLKMHDRSGATVTVGEEPRLLPFIPKINDDKDTVIRKMKNLRREAEKHNLTIEAFAESGKYMAPGKTTLTPDEVVDQPKGRSAAGKVGAALPTYRTQAEVDKLKPGTQFLGPDGKTYTKN